MLAGRPTPDYYSTSLQADASSSDSSGDSGNRGCRSHAKGGGLDPHLDDDASSAPPAAAVAHTTFSSVVLSDDALKEVGVWSASCCFFLHATGAELQMLAGGTPSVNSICLLSTRVAAQVLARVLDGCRYQVGPMLKTVRCPPCTLHPTIPFCQEVELHFNKYNDILDGVNDYTLEVKKAAFSFDIEATGTYFLLQPENLLNLLKSSGDVLRGSKPIIISAAKSYTRNKSNSGFIAKTFAGPLKASVTRMVTTLPLETEDAQQLQRDVQQRVSVSLCTCLLCANQCPVLSWVLCTCTLLGLAAVLPTGRSCYEPGANQLLLPTAAPCLQLTRMFTGPADTLAAEISMFINKLEADIKDTQAAWPAVPNSVKVVLLAGVAEWACAKMFFIRETFCNLMYGMGKSVLGMGAVVGAPEMPFQPSEAPAIDPSALATPQGGAAAVEMPPAASAIMPGAAPAASDATEEQGSAMAAAAAGEQVVQGMDSLNV